MRAKVVLPILVLAMLLGGLAFWFRPVAPRTLESTPVSPPAQVTPQAASREAIKPVAPPFASEKPAGRVARLSGPPAAVDEDHAAATADRVAELNRLAMTGDANSLDAILSELNNPEHEIRMAAISASIDFGSRDAIPALQNALAGADDLKEKVEIQRAIDFLRLPSVFAKDNQNQEATGK